MLDRHVSRAWIILRQTVYLSQEPAPPQVLGALLRSLGGPRAPAQLTASVFLWDR